MNFEYRENMDKVEQWRQSFEEKKLPVITLCQIDSTVRQLNEIAFVLYDKFEYSQDKIFEAIFEAVIKDTNFDGELEEKK